MKKLKERGRAALDNVDKLENKNRTKSLEMAYLKKINIKIFLLDHSFLLGSLKLVKDQN